MRTWGDKGRSAWLRGTPVLLTVAVVATMLGGCKDDDGGGRTGSAASTSPPRPQFQPAPAGAGSAGQGGAWSSLTGVADDGETVVAVGTAQTAGVTQPWFVRSTDSGDTWQLASVTRDSAPANTLSDQADLVVHGRLGWLAMGSADRGAAVWTSSDGSSWVRQRTSVPAFRAGDDVTGVAAHPALGWVAVGTAAGVNGQSATVPVVWSSSDGRTWKRAESPAGLAVKGATVSPTGVVVIGRRILVSGTTDFEGWEALDGEGPDYQASVFTSDDGARFTRRAMSAQVQERTRSSANGIRVVDGHPVVLLRISHDGTDSWDGGVDVGTADGKSWRHQAVNALATTAEENLSALDGAKGRWVFGGSTISAAPDAVLAAGADAERAKAVSDVSLRGPGEQDISDVALVGARGIAVGTTVREGSTSGQMWRVEGSTARAVSVPRPRQQVTVSLSGLTISGSQVVASGTAGRPTVWTFDGSATTRNTGFALPGASASDDTYVVRPVDLGAGRVLQMATTTTGDVSRVSGWLRDDANTWSPLDVSALGPRGTFHQTAVIGAAVKGTTWVVAGWGWDSERSDGRIWVTRNGGKSWSEARSGSKSTDPGSRPTYTGLWAPADGGVAVSDVTATDAGFVAVVNQWDEQDRTVPRWVSSRDGRTWTVPADLPPIQGMVSTSAEGVVSHGASVVVTGSALTRGGSDPVAVLWVSTNGGKNWKVARSPEGESADVNRVLAVPGGWLALGAVGEGRDTDAAAWTSRDGLSWKTAALDVPTDGTRATKGPGEQSFADAVVRSDKLVLQGTNIRPGGGGPYLAEVAVPRP